MCIRDRCSRRPWTRTGLSESRSEPLPRRPSRPCPMAKTCASTPYWILKAALSHMSSFTACTQRRGVRLCVEEARRCVSRLDVACFQDQ
eukprot:537311-Rhodomonas_salina.1